MLFAGPAAYKREARLVQGLLLHRLPRYGVKKGEQMPKAPFSLYLPDVQTTHVVFASPHSGRDYPWEFLQKSVLDERMIRSSEDAFVDLLYASAVENGAPLLIAHAPRAFLDLNRAAEELDPAVIEGVRKTAHNPRVTSGLGVIPRVVANGRSIYHGKITREEANARINGYWLPYHNALKSMINDTKQLFGEAVLIDCHSMPHEAIEGITTNGQKPADIVLGDRFGAAASQDVVEWIEAAFANAGLKVVRNAPFAGAYTAQHYGRPNKGQHVIQIEIDRSLYMNERMIRPNGNFHAFKDLLAGIVSEICQMGRKDLGLAAE